MLRELAKPGKPDMAFIKQLTDLHEVLMDCRHGGEEKSTKLAMRALELPQHLKIDATVTDEQFKDRLNELMDSFSRRLEMVEEQQSLSMRNIKDRLKRADESASRIRGSQLSLLDRSILQEQIGRLISRQLA